MTRRYAPGITRAGIIFIFVALLLAGAVWAGVYFVQQRGEQVRREGAAEIARQNLEEQSETPVISEEEENETENGSNNGGTGTPNEEEPQPTTPTTGTAPTDMPQTGPEAVQLVALFALITSITFFVASRKAVRQL